MFFNFSITLKGSMLYNCGKFLKIFFFFLYYIYKINLKVIESSFNINNLSIELRGSISFKFCKHLKLVEIIMILIKTYTKVMESYFSVII